MDIIFNGLEIRKNTLELWIWNIKFILIMNIDDSNVVHAFTISSKFYFFYSGF